MGDILTEDEYLEFVYRWNFLQFKLAQVKKYLSIHHFNASLAFVRSMEHDVTALSSLIHDAHEKIHSYLQCGEV